MFVEIRKELLADEEHAALPLVLCAIGKSTPQTVVNRPEGFQYHHFIWVTQGEGLFVVAGQRMLLKKGDGLFFRRLVPNAYEPASDHFCTEWVTFLGADALLDYVCPAPFFRFPTRPTLSEATAALDALARNNSTPISRSAAGYAWLTELLEPLFTPAEPIAAAVQQFLETHYGEPLTLEDIADQVHMGRYALCHYYRQAKSMTVMEQLKLIRLAKARQFLRWTAFPVAEVGAMCGYESPSYFGQQFRLEAGCSPREYRERYTH